MSTAKKEKSISNCTRLKNTLLHAELEPLSTRSLSDELTIHLIKRGFDRALWAAERIGWRYCRSGHPQCPLTVQVHLDDAVFEFEKSPTTLWGNSEECLNRNKVIRFVVYGSDESLVFRTSLRTCHSTDYMLHHIERGIDWDAERCKAALESEVENTSPNESQRTPTHDQPTQA